MNESDLRTDYEKMSTAEVEILSNIIRVLERPNLRVSVHFDKFAFRFMFYSSAAQAITLHFQRWNLAFELLEYVRCNNEKENATLLWEEKLK